MRTSIGKYMVHILSDILCTQVHPCSKIYLEPHGRQDIVKKNRTVFEYLEQLLREAAALR